MTGAPAIRRATRADLPRIGHLGALLVEQHHAFDPLRFLSVSDRTPAEYASFIGTQLADPDVVVLVAHDEGRVIAYAYGAVEGYDWMELRGPAGVVHDIVVDPQVRRRGVGRLLLGQILAYLKSRGAPRVVLFTAERNEPAQRLFAGIGFRRTMVEMTCELD
jgi:ribosomal protein S18 acetylase RimI-like enzyme